MHDPEGLPAFGRGPLWPAGHLPHTGGDWLSTVFSPIADIARRVTTFELPISPLVGEMAGRPEGGAKERRLERERNQ
jgi:hypothetical protein